ncbi:MAG: hypothetical protein GXO89_16790 [Chlorobi bacterium]|nr:hypothetical protein [Chlorobiota bacterium]
MIINKFLIIVSILIASFAYSQEDIDNQGGKTKISGINEISYALPMAFGYNHIQNFNDKLLIGAGFHLGIGFYFRRYVDLFQLKVFTRNVFNNNKFEHKLDYDIGLFFSFPSSAIEVSPFYGIVSSVYYNFWRMKIGVEILTGTMQEKESFKNDPVMMFTPSLIFNLKNY